MQKEIKVWETIETVTILSSDQEGVYRVIWHRSSGPKEEFHVTPAEGDTVEEAIAKDLRSRMGP
jgi:hypothetical protein